jgi:hypothetical protein
MENQHIYLKDIIATDGIHADFIIAKFDFDHRYKKITGQFRVDEIPYIVYVLEHNMNGIVETQEYKIFHSCIQDFDKL